MLSLNKLYKLYGPPIGRGSSRAVFRISDRWCIKYAVSKIGIYQNMSEVAAFSAGYNDLLADISEYDPCYAWVKMELCKPVLLHEFVQYFDYSPVELVSYLVYELSGGVSPSYRFDVEAMRKNVFANKLLAFVRANNICPEDLEYPDQWGLARDGKLVIIDYGLPVWVWEILYERRRGRANQ